MNAGPDLDAKIDELVFGAARWVRRHPNSTAKYHKTTYWIYHGSLYNRIYNPSEYSTNIMYAMTVVDKILDLEGVEQVEIVKEAFTAKRPTVVTVWGNHPEVGRWVMGQATSTSTAEAICQAAFAAVTIINKQKAA